MTTTQRRKAAETAATQLRRLLHLIPELADDRAHPIAEVARLAGTTPRALLADLNALVERYDVPAGWVDGVSILVDGENVTVRSDHFLRPMRLTMPELCALELGLMLAHRDSAADDRRTIESALGRLRSAIARLPSNDRHGNLRAAVVVDAGSGDTLAIVRGAVRAGRKLRIAYRAGAADESSERTVSPYGVALASGAWYLVAHCDRSEGLRFFRLDRMERAESLAEPFDRPAAFSMDAMLPEGRAFSAEGSGTMTVRYSPRIARWIAEREGKPLAPDGSLTLVHPLADEDWAMRHVLQYGPDAVVVAPPGLGEAIKERLSAIGYQLTDG